MRTRRLADAGVTLRKALAFEAVGKGQEEGRGFGEREGQSEPVGAEKA